MRAVHYLRFHIFRWVTYFIFRLAAVFFLSLATTLLSSFIAARQATILMFSFRRRHFRHYAFTMSATILLRAMLLPLIRAF